MSDISLFALKGSPTACFGGLNMTTSDECDRYKVKFYSQIKAHVCEMPKDKTNCQTEGLLRGVKKKKASALTTYFNYSVFYV